jgi:hypothetical protein
MCVKALQLPIIRINAKMLSTKTYVDGRRSSRKPSEASADIAKSVFVSERDQSNAASYRTSATDATWSGQLVSRSYH